MHVDQRYAWLTFEPAFTVDQVARYREMAAFDADKMPEPECDACLDSGIATVEVRDQWGNTAVADIDCPDCDAKTEKRAAA